LNATSDIFVSSGKVIENLVNRYFELEQSYLALADSNIFTRWFVFLKEVDWEIAVGTWNNFVPGVPTTMEGLVYAIAGLLAGWGVYTGLKTICTYPFRSKPVNIKRAS